MSYLPALHSAIFDKAALVLIWLACVGLVALLGGIVINWGSGNGEKPDETRLSRIEGEIFSGSNNQVGMAGAHGMNGGVRK